MEIIDTHSGKVLDIPLTEESLRILIKGLNRDYIKYGWISENKYYDYLMSDYPKRTFIGEDRGWLYHKDGDLFGIEKVTVPVTIKGLNCQLTCILVTTPKT